MRTLLLTFFLISYAKLAYSCSCSREGDESYDFIALVEICNNEPIFSDSSYSGCYRSDIDIIELYKGPSLSHVFVWSGFPGLSWTSCDRHFKQNSQWIIRASFSSGRNDFITGFCSYNSWYKNANGFRNWAFKNPDHTINEYRKKYSGKEPWRFTGDTLIQHYPNGNIEFLEPYKGGQLHGTVKRYYPSGKLFRIENYKNGKLDGVQKRFYKKSNLPNILNYKDGRKHGEWIWYYHNGEIQNRRIYSHNQIAFEEKKIGGIISPEKRILENYDFSTCTKETKWWNEHGALEYHSFSYHNGNSETWDFDYKGNLKSYTFWNSKKRQRISSKF